MSLLLSNLMQQLKQFKLIELARYEGYPQDQADMSGVYLRGR